MTADGFLLPKPSDADMRTEWTLSPSLNVHPREVAERVHVDLGAALRELADWRKDFPDPALWRRPVVAWPDGATFVGAWTLSEEAPPRRAVLDEMCGARCFEDDPLCVKPHGHEFGPVTDLGRRQHAGGLWTWPVDEDDDERGFTDDDVEVAR